MPVRSTILDRDHSVFNVNLVEDQKTLQLTDVSYSQTMGSATATAGAAGPSGDYGPD